MTVGSILAATDPGAVATFLVELGAPHRLQVHIAGESLLNDGSAIVSFRSSVSDTFPSWEFPDLGRK
jgi:NhaP-type Na+/H+ or K+/H+ antiporter